MSGTGSTTGSHFANPPKTLINSSCEVLKQNQLFEILTVFPANISILTRDFFLTGAVNTVVVNGVAFPIVKGTLAQRAGVRFP